ncbi:MAG TPA: histidine kinase [Ohtaekwangia sp.]|nr:histidine kinase [Ohtaekwangia sp.]
MTLCGKKITLQVLFIELRDIAFLLAGGFVMTLAGISCRNCEFNTEKFWMVASFTAMVWVTLWKGNEYLASYISLKVSWLRFPVRRFLIGLMATVVYSVMAMYTLGAIYTWSFRVDFFAFGLWFSIGITIMISLFLHGRAFLMSWKQSAIDAERLQKESMAAKYESLKSQVNPHFLFNSLNALTNLVYEDQDKAAAFIKHLSDVYRYVLDSREKELVPIAEELHFLNAYLYLQQIRFGDKLRLNIDLAGTQSMVAPLVLQLLVENAIKHNVVAEDHPLAIRLYATDGFIVVENNILKKTVLPEESSGMGLENICRRYEFLSAHRVEIVRHPMFVVRLPVIPIPL